MSEKSAGVGEVFARYVRDEGCDESVMRIRTAIAATKEIARRDVIEQLTSALIDAMSEASKGSSATRTEVAVAVEAVRLGVLQTLVSLWQREHGKQEGFALSRQRPKAEA